MPAINIYLNFNGNCREAFDHYKKVLGGTYSYLSTFADMPPNEAFEIPEDDKDRIMHVALQVSKETVLMGSDTISSNGDAVFGNNFSVSISTENKAQASHFFQGLSEGGEILQPMTEMFWGDYFGMLLDRFGINWMVSFDMKQQAEK